MMNSRSAKHASVNISKAMVNNKQAPTDHQPLNHAVMAERGEHPRPGQPSSGHVSNPKLKRYTRVGKGPLRGAAV